MSGPSAGVLVLGAAGVAAAQLDATGAGQLMLSRPIVVGPVLGCVLGDPALGAAFGVLYELFNLGDLPVGGRIPINATASSGAGLLLAAGAGGASPELAFPAGLFVGWLHARGEDFLRHARSGLGTLVEMRLARGEPAGLGRLALRELGREAGLTFALLLLALAARPLLAAVGGGLPEPLTAGLRFALQMAPWLGLSSALAALKVVT